ncbi:unnamed protein product [Polarella glacialis]|uniref:Uncharacterized protein n=1 Tax=Polarella glacialis TaxID=89957 RepID=A0A813J3F3_POLGL|nr:unnamed protein product [Polarella glacialis]
MKLLSAASYDLLPIAGLTQALKEGRETALLCYQEVAQYLDSVRPTGAKSQIPAQPQLLKDGTTDFSPVVMQLTGRLDRLTVAEEERKATEEQELAAFQKQALE